MTFFFAAAGVLLAVQGHLEGLNRLPPAQVRSLPPPPQPSPVVAAATPPRLLWVLVDGLRDDALARMPRLQALARQGVRLHLHSGHPSFSRPIYTVLGTGASQARSGVRTNSWRGPVSLDSLFARLADDGRRSVAVMERIGWWTELFGPSLRNGGVADGVAQVTGLAARQLAAPGQVELLLVHFTGVDHLSHHHGAGSPEVADEIVRVDRAIERLLSGIDLSRWAVLVHSDHGHVVGGGHGGTEPEVVLAPAVLAGARVSRRPESWDRPPEAAAVDLAPTLAALLDSAPPAQAEGRILTELLDGPPAAWAPATALLAASQRQLWQAWASALAGPPPAPAPGAGAQREAAAVAPGGVGGAMPLERRLVQALEAGQLARVRGQGLAAASLIVPLLLLLALRVGRHVLPRRERCWWLLAALGYPVLVFTCYLAWVGQLSFSDIPLRAVFVRRLVLLLVAAGAPLAVAVLLRLRRAAPAERGELARALACVLLLGIAPWHLAAQAWAAVLPGMQLAGATALFLPLVSGPMLAAYLLGAGLLLLVPAAAGLADGVGRGVSEMGKSRKINQMLQG
ncbi:MAG: alkaline phosphatase family protein [Deltaproteobacteria bacterium]|nr:alkaline phosphatase family protein [Deltaproteobacteria bacterium]